MGFMAAWIAAVVVLAVMTGALLVCAQRKNGQLQADLPLTLSSNAHARAATAGSRDADEKQTSSQSCPIDSTAAEVTFTLPATSAKRRGGTGAQPPSGGPTLQALQDATRVCSGSPDCIEAAWMVGVDPCHEPDEQAATHLCTAECAERTAAACSHL